jgi:hypothetical protein
MPTIYRQDGYRFFFFSMEGTEPAHVHVEQAGEYAKFWLDGVTLARNRGFASHELTVIRRIIEKNRESFEEKWNEFFSD